MTTGAPTPSAPAPTAPRAIQKSDRATALPAPTGGNTKLSPAEWEDLQVLVHKSNDRFVLLPLEHEDIWKAYEKAKSVFWTVEEVDLSRDKRDWDTRLDDGARHFIKHVLAFFAASDGIVNENLMANFGTEITITEARFFYGFQIMMENMHAHMYSKLIETLVEDAAERRMLFNAVETVPCVARKAEWALKYSDERYASLPERLVAFTAVEGIFFSGSFCAIFWLRKSGKLPGLALSNDFISRDEGLHCEFACLLYNKLDAARLSADKVYEIVGAAVDIESEFVCEALSVSLVGMNVDLMKEYIRFCADFHLKNLGYKPLYNATMPFEWMDIISMDGKTNFFEKRLAEYAKAGVGGDPEESEFSLDADF